MGNRDCGKSIEYGLLKNSLGPYVETFDLQNILYIRKTERVSAMGEVSRMLAWTLDLEFARLAVSQEIPNPSTKKVINGILLKKLTGGSDIHRARRNYDKADTVFKTAATFYIKGNNSVRTDTADCMETCVEFASVYQFKRPDDIEYLIKQEMESRECSRKEAEDKLRNFYRVADDKIGEKIESIEWCNAVIYLLSEYYSQTHQLGKVTIRPEEEEDAGDVEEEATTSLRKKLEATFEITLNPEHKLLVATVLDTMFTFCQDRKKITKELEAMRCIKKKDRRSGDTHNKWVFQGMREKPKPTDAT